MGGMRAIRRIRMFTIAMGTTYSRRQEGAAYVSTRGFTLEATITCAAQVGGEAALELGGCAHIFIQYSIHPMRKSSAIKSLLNQRLFDCIITANKMCMIESLSKPLTSTVEATSSM